MRSICYVLLLTSFLSIPFFRISAQDTDPFGEDSVMQNLTIATFKSIRVVNGQSVELAPEGEMIFTVSHHFGAVNGGLKQFFGLDQSTIRLGLDFSPFERFSVGIGRSSFNKTLDGSVKIKVLRQQSGKRNIPLTAVWYSSAALRTAPWPDPDREYLFSHRMAYTHQLLLARKFSSTFSFQVSGGLVHYNMVPLSTDYNNQPVLGLGARYKILPRLTLNGECFLVPEEYAFADTYPSLSLGFDLETGGHVFQLYFSNSMALYDHGFLAETAGRWTKGEIFFGFNITRVFSLYD